MRTGQSKYPSSAQATDAPQIPGRVIAGNRLTFVQPIYPPQAKADKVQGAVVLSARIEKDGTVKILKVVSGPEPLRKSAVDAVSQWTYKPYLMNGKPVAVDTTMTINFSIQGK